MTSPYALAFLSALSDLSRGILVVFAGIGIAFVLGWIYWHLVPTSRK